MNVNSPTSERSLKAADKKIRALELRKAGNNYNQIAEVIGCSARMASNYVNKAIKETTEKTSELTQHVIEIELQRLDDMLLSLKDKIVLGQLGAIDKALKIMERRAKLLGLDKPAKIAPTNPEGDSQYEPEFSYKDRLATLLKRKTDT